MGKRRGCISNVFLSYFDYFFGGGGNQTCVERHQRGLTRFVGKPEGAEMYF